MNNVVLMGRLTKDPDLRINSNDGNGLSVCNITLAVKRIGKKDTQPDFINCVAFGKNAENISNNLIKGNQLLIRGNLKTGSYENTEGKKVYTTSVVIETFDYIGNKVSSNEPESVDDADNPF